MDATKNLVLIGYRGTGKTSVARLLAERLGWHWVDADDEVERRAGKTIAEIFAQDGEKTFRDWESQTVASLFDQPQTVVAAGGGVVIRPENRRLLQRGETTVVWLTASPETIRCRIRDDAATASRRPRLTDQSVVDEVSRVLRERIPLYAACADVQVDTEGKSPEEVAEEILSWLGRAAGREST